MLPIGDAPPRGLMNLSPSPLPLPLPLLRLPAAEESMTLSTSSMSACKPAKDALASSAAMAAAQGATLLHERDGYSVDVNRHRPYTY